MFDSRKPPGENDIIVAKAAAVSAAGVSLFLPEATIATQTYYQRLESANVAAGDLVLCLRVSGTIVVLGRII